LREKSITNLIQNGANVPEKHKNVFEKTAEMATLILDIDRCGIWLFDDNGSVLACLNLYDKKSAGHHTGLSYQTDNIHPLFEKLKTQSVVEIRNGCFSIGENVKIPVFPETYFALLTPFLLDSEVNGFISFEPSDENRIWTEDEKIIASELVAHLTVSRELSTFLDKEQATTKEQERLRLFYELANEGIVIHENGAVLDANPVACRITGYNYNEIVGMSALELLTPENRDMAKQNILRDYNKPYEVDVLTKDNKRIPFEICGKNILYRGKNCRVVVVRNITERRENEEEMRKKEGMYRHLFQHSNDGIVLHDYDGNILDINNKAVKMFGLTREEFLSCNVPDFHIPGEYVETSKGYDVLAKEGRLSFEANLIKKNKEIFLAEISASMFEWYGKSVIHSIIRDLTERKKAAEEQKKLQDQLERAQRMESLGVLAGGVAHDLNNILGPLVGYPELILKKLPPGDKASKQVKLMGKAAREAADVIQDLLTLARRGRYDMMPVNINDITEEYLASPNFIELRKKNPDVILEKNVNNDIGKISGSAIHLRKVIMNLVVNAFDAMPEGGRLVIETTNNQLDRLQGGYDEIDRGDYIIVKISDTGIGIEPADLKNIFEPYYSKKKMGTNSGSGLGLSVVYGILKDHKGYYDVISKPGEGTEFILYFSSIRQEITSEKASLIEPEGIRGNEKILIIDDVYEQRELAKEMLAGLGYKVVTASNGRDAITYLKSRKIDLIVLDMIMEKDFDGLDTYREIIKLHPHQKVVVASGFSATDRVNEIIKLGAGQYIKKPFTQGTFGHAVRRELDK